MPCFIVVSICVLTLLKTEVDANIFGKFIRSVSPDVHIMDQERTTEQTHLILSKDHFFQDIFSEHFTPFNIQFGHVCENPNEWEQRFEQRDLENNRYRGKVKWGDKDGKYGEHYWDLNH